MPLWRIELIGMRSHRGFSEITARCLRSPLIHSSQSAIADPDSPSSPPRPSGTLVRPTAFILPSASANPDAATPRHLIKTPPVTVLFTGILHLFYVVWDYSDERFFDKAVCILVSQRCMRVRRRLIASPQNPSDCNQYEDMMSGSASCPFSPRLASIQVQC